MNDLVRRINETGERVFYNPRPLLSYYTLATDSLASNTFRGFHRIDKAKPGSKGVFDSIFIQNRDYVIKNIKKANTEENLNECENEICQKLIYGLKNNIVSSQLTSFNKIRKPVDIVFEHMVSMGEDFVDARKAIVKHLFLPLDSQMFQSDFVFSDTELTLMKIKRNFTFKDIESKEHYLHIQDFLKRKAEKLGLGARIFFDLIWNDRYTSSGTNLFGTNPR